MNRPTVLFIHTKYRQQGGEDAVVAAELALLDNHCKVSTLIFSNTSNRVKNTVDFLLLPFNPISFARTLFAVVRYRPSVIHLHNWHFAASPSVIWAARLCGVPVVHTLHNYRLLCPSGTLYHNDALMMNSLEESFPWTAVRQKVYRNSGFQTFYLSFAVYLNRLFTWRMVNRYIALTPSASELFLKAPLALKQTQVTVKPNFTPHLPFVQEIRKKYFLFAGRLTSEKGIEQLLNTFARLPDAQLVICGDGPMRQQVEAATVSNPNIEYRGFQHHEAILKALQECEALLFPSRWLEGMPITIIEALSCGTPVIATNIGAMSSMLQNRYNGLLYSPSDSNGLANAIANWKELSEEEKRTLGIHARCTFERNHTAALNLNILLGIYHDCTKDNRFKKGAVLTTFTQHILTGREPAAPAPSTKIFYQ